MRHEGEGLKDSLATVDVFSNAAGGALAGEDVYPGDVAASGGYIGFPFIVELREIWPDLEYRILYHGAGDLWADQVRLAPEVADLPVGQFEMEDAPGDPAFGIVTDEGASGGEARFAGQDAPSGVTIEAPVGNLVPGDYRAEFTLKAAPEEDAGSVATLEVLSGGDIIASRTLSAGDFASPDAYQSFAVEFGAAGPNLLPDVTLRIRREGVNDVWADVVQLVYRYHEPG